MFFTNSATNLPKLKRTIYLLASKRPFIAADAVPYSGRQRLPRTSSIGQILFIIIAFYSFGPFVISLRIDCLIKIKKLQFIFSGLRCQIMPGSQRKLE